MQFKGKPINQTLENRKRPNLGPAFGLFGPNLGPKTFFAGYTSISIQKLFQAIILCNLKEN